jgi:rhodanese-related sulfurtransferase
VGSHPGGPGAVPALTAADAIAAVAGGAALVDVRERSEWAAGHAPQALLLPLSELGQRVAELPRTGRVVVVCRSGRRSAGLVTQLVAVGVDAVNLDGGMQAWRDAGGDLVSDAGTPAII